MPQATTPAPALPADYYAAAKQSAESVAAAYCHRCWWAERDELRNQCWLIAMQVWTDAQGFSDAFTGGAAGYGTVCYVAAMRQMGRWLRRQQSPITIGSDHAVKEVSELTTRNSAHLLRLEARSDLEGEVMVKEIRRRIRERLLDLCGHSPEVEASTLVLLDGLAAREAAEAMSLDVQAVYRWNEVVVGAARTDAEVGKLAAELAAERSWTCRA